MIEAAPFGRLDQMLRPAVNETKRKKQKTKRTLLKKDFLNVVNKVPSLAQIVHRITSNDRRRRRCGRHHRCRRLNFCSSHYSESWLPNVGLRKIKKNFLSFIFEFNLELELGLKLE